MNLFGNQSIERLTLTLLWILPIASVVYPARSAEQIKLSDRYELRKILFKINCGIVITAKNITPKEASFCR